MRQVLFSRGSDYYYKVGGLLKKEVWRIYVKIFLGIGEKFALIGCECCFRNRPNSVRLATANSPFSNRYLYCSIMRTEKGGGKGREETSQIFKERPE